MTPIFNARNHRRVGIGLVGTLVVLLSAIYVSNKFRRKNEIKAENGDQDSENDLETKANGEILDERHEVVDDYQLEQETQSMSSSKDKSEKNMTFEEVKAFYKAHNEKTLIDEDALESHASIAEKSQSNAEGIPLNSGVIFEEYGETWAPSMIPSHNKATQPNSAPDFVVDKKFWVPLLADRSMPGFTNTNETEDAESLRNFTYSQLQTFVGEDGLPIYIAIQGDVFDVTRAKAFYGPRGQYSMLAGHDASICLAKLKYEKGYLNRNVSTFELSKKEKRELRNWYKNFKEYKEYPMVGKIAEVPIPRQYEICELNQMMGTQTVPEGYAIPPMCIGINGNIYDVSFGGVQFYEEGAAYHIFVGKDVTRALAKLSFSDEDIGNPKLDDLNEQEMKTLSDWETTFREKKQYPIIGTYKM